MPIKQKVDVNLGASLRNSRGNLKKERKQKKGAPSTLDEVEDCLSEEEPVTKSVLEESSVQEFMARAQLADMRFVAERQTAHMVLEDGSRVVSAHMEQAQQATQELIDKHKDKLKIPRRPPPELWDTADELHTAEKTMFLQWRRVLADLEQVDNLLLTPFERNLEMWRQLWRVLERSDLVAQIVDARHPLLFYNQDLQQYVNDLPGHKQHVVLLNKAELLSAEQRQYWKDYFASINVNIIFWSALIEDQPTSVEQSIAEEAESEAEGSEDGSSVSESERPAQPVHRPISETVHVADAYLDPPVCSVTALIGQLKCLAQRSLVESGRQSQQVTVGMVGYPNVGKSSTINRVLGRKKVAVSATPGKTLHFQTLVVDNELQLCDSPGLVMPSLAVSKAEMLLYGILPIAQLRDPHESITVLCSRVPKTQLQHSFGIMLPPPALHERQDRPPTSTELLTCVAFVRGFMAAKGIPDMSRAARIVLKTVVEGRLVCAQPPPGIDATEYRSLAVDRSNKRQQSSAPQTLLDQLTQKRLLNSASARTQDLDSDFFAVDSTKARLKGRKAQKLGPTGKAIGDKRHNNRKSKEKLRRVFGGMDA